MAAGTAALGDSGMVVVDVAPSASKAEPTSAGAKSEPARRLAPPDWEDENDYILAAAVTPDTQ